ncbi:MAG: 7-carboxy-7-deazaguanine synthase [Candidatus Marinimicrobia bacterium]|jgi:7-carboxy-7-deazaguanine synthase|nr:7-carboxy-7-deazaguanine synthase [Candidatus Neomarinimicrobiota bacterium]|tara:strand:- start:2209 stop:2841 length:633 start_codon:yes stop_codon:yes gene_type:complete
MYSIKETYFTIQGEGFHTGRSAVFVRFAGCNLWSGHEKDRAKALCKFCDTDFVGIDGPGGGKFATASKLADHILSKWPKGTNTEPFVVCTGGEPLLQIDSELVEALHDNKFEIAIETNGTIKPPQGIDWICVSPKAESDVLINKGDELKLVYPQEGAEPSKYEHLEFDYFSLQPMDSDQLEENTKKTIEYCNQHPLWRLSLQTHKFLGIP